jgi:hypothetical protein
MGYSWGHATRLPNVEKVKLWWIREQREREVARKDEVRQAAKDAKRCQGDIIIIIIILRNIT